MTICRGHRSLHGPRCRDCGRAQQNGHISWRLPGVRSRHNCAPGGARRGLASAAGAAAVGLGPLFPCTSLHRPAPQDCVRRCNISIFAMHHAPRRNALCRRGARTPKGVGDVGPVRDPQRSCHMRLAAPCTGYGACGLCDGLTQTLRVFRNCSAARKLSTSPGVASADCKHLPLPPRDKVNQTIDPNNAFEWNHHCAARLRDGQMEQMRCPDGG